MKKHPETFYVTTPIYYVNDRPHIGHAYCTVLADVLRRFHTMFGAETYFLTGVDEHGQKVEEAAKKRGLTPQAHCDEMQAHFRDLWPTLDVANDDFIRTTEERHIRVVQEALQWLHQRDLIYRGEYEGFYSPRVEKFFTEAELKDGRCPETGGEVHKIKEANYFFRMSLYRDQLIDHIHKHPDFIRPESRRNEVLGFLAQPLSDLCISRPKKRLSWGIELPFDPDYVTYVWFDALLNYASAIGLYADPPRFEHWWPGVRHLIGKDILTTHCVYWMTMLMALEIPLPKEVIAHGWWLIDDTKMSKSLGNVVSPLALRDKVGTDSLRYFLMREMVVGQDASFSELALLRRHNSDLANDLGNLLSRLVKFVGMAFDGAIPPLGPEEGPDAEVRVQAEALPEQVERLVRGLRVETAIETTMELVRRLNRYVVETEPFKRVKTNPVRAGHTCRVALEGVRIALNCLWPIMPRKVSELLQVIGAGAPVKRLADLCWGLLPEGTKIAIQETPFPRFDLKIETAAAAAPSACDTPAAADKTVQKPAPQAPAASDTISIDLFQQVRLVVGTVMTVEPIQGSNKLLRLQVDLGEAQLRQVVAGIALAYKPEELVGKQVVVLANLQPRKVFGVESRGMIMAASDESNLGVLAPSRPVKPGTRIS